MADGKLRSPFVGEKFNSILEIANRIYIQVYSVAIAIVLGHKFPAIEVMVPVLEVAVRYRFSTVGEIDYNCRSPKSMVAAKSSSNGENDSTLREISSVFREKL